MIEVELVVAKALKEDAVDMVRVVGVVMMVMVVVFHLKQSRLPRKVSLMQWLWGRPWLRRW